MIVPEVSANENHDHLMAMRKRANMFILQNKLYTNPLMNSTPIDVQQSVQIQWLA